MKNVDFIPDEVLAKVQIVPYVDQSWGFTHWFLDPETSDPVPVVKVKNDHTLREHYVRVPQRLMEMLVKAFPTDQFAVLVTRMAMKGAKVLSDIERWDFPRQEHAKMERHLREMNEDDTPKLPITEEAEVSSMNPVDQLRRRMNLVRPVPQEEAPAVMEAAKKMGVPIEIVGQGNDSNVAQAKATMPKPKKKTPQEVLASVTVVVDEFDDDDDEEYDDQPEELNIVHEK